MKDTYNNNSQAIYIKALETAAEEVAFYQSKLEKSKELFSLCEKLLAGLADDSQASSVRTQKANKAPRYSVCAKILNAFRESDSQWATVAELASRCGLNPKAVGNWIIQRKDIEKRPWRGHAFFKEYRLIQPAAKKPRGMELSSTNEKKFWMGMDLTWKTVREISQSNGCSPYYVRQFLLKHGKYVDKKKTDYFYRYTLNLAGLDMKGKIINSPDVNSPDEEIKNTEKSKKTDNIREALKSADKELPVRDIVKTTGFSENRVNAWIRKNLRELEVSLSKNIRAGWNVRTFKLKA